MYDMGMYPGRPFKKCARIVGEVLGKYHPHGDMAVYDALVRLAQEFASRYPLIEGHGNFGSVDGDAPAAMRYTEARLAPLAMELLRDIDKETVEFIPNFDDTLKEPSVLPARFPNLLVNGSSGIAVGMATNIPPHNLGEVIDGVVMLIDKPQAEVCDLMKVVKGPDFPTGGIIVGKEGIREMYETGRGSIKVRGRALIEEEDKLKIVITEIPYQINKANLAAKIAELAREKKLPEVSDLRDESDREGIRLVVELKRDCIPKVALNKLYKHTQLQTTFGANLLALVDGVPKTLNLKEALSYYLDHQKTVVRNRLQFELAGAEKRAHIVLGLLVALDHLDEVIELIKKSRDPRQAEEKLIKKFDLSQPQAQAILDMKLQRLTQLEREKLQSEHKELVEKIKKLKEILASEEKLLKLIKEELLELKKKFADERRTKISLDAKTLTTEDLVPDQEVLVSLTGSGYIKRLPPSVYRRQLRGGKGVAGAKLKEGDWVSQVFVASTHDYLMLFSNLGLVYRLKVYEVPPAGRTARGKAIINLLPLRDGEKIVSGFPLKSFDESKCLFFVTKKGRVKRTALSHYATTRQTGLIALTLRKGDELLGVSLSDGRGEAALFTRSGRAIRFSEEQVRMMGRVASGVKGIDLRAPGDEVVAFELVGDSKEVLMVTEKGYGKRTNWNLFPKQGRGGLGVKAITLTQKKGQLAAAISVSPEDEVVLVTSLGQVIRLRAKGVSRLGRYAQGVKLMNLSSSDQVTALTKI
jgi:DNA gyrase subunit A